VVDNVARDFDLGDSTTSGALTVPAVVANGGAGTEKFDLVDALRSLATLADRLKQEEKDLPDERKL
jgi:hypothetical protein